MESVSFKYKLSAEAVLECFRIAGKKDIRKTIIKSLLFAALFVFWIYEFIKDSSSYISFILAAVCFAFCLLVWYLPVRNKKSLAAEIELADNEYYMEFSGESIYFNEEKTDFVPVKNGERYYETENLFILDMGADRVFCVAKKERTPEEISFIRNYLNGELYVDKRKKKPLEEKING